MWWVIIIGIVVAVIIKFAYDSNKQAESVSKQGGMRIKYRTLINYVLESDSKAKIFKETSTFISVGVSSLGGTTVFLIQQTFGKVNIQWKFDSPVFGNHKLEWDFDEFLDQNKMIQKIENDLSIYQSNVMQKFM